MTTYSKPPALTVENLNRNAYEDFILDGDSLARVLTFAAKHDIVGVRTGVVSACPVCGQPCDQLALVSTGLPLEHYQPDMGEVLKNVAMVCDACGWDQYS